MSKGYLCFFGRSNQPDSCCEIELLEEPKREPRESPTIFYTKYGILKAKKTDKVFSWVDLPLFYSGPIKDTTKPYIECRARLELLNGYLYLHLDLPKESNLSELLNVPSGILQR